MPRALSRWRFYNYALGGVEGATADVIVPHQAGSGPGIPAPGVTEAIVTRNSVTKKTTYEIIVPAAALGMPPPLTAGTEFGLGMAINDGDAGPGQDGQKGWGGLGAHAIVFGKSPSHTALVTLGAQGPTVDRLFFSAINPTLDAEFQSPTGIPLANHCMAVTIQMIFYSAMKTSAVASRYFLAFLFTSGFVSAQVAGPNGNSYEVVIAQGLPWDEARARAEQASFNGMKGHLATVTSSDEDNFIESLRQAASPPGDGALWLGGFQAPGQSSPYEGWTWVNGEGGFPGQNGGGSYSNWQTGEPNDYWGPESENYLSTGHFNAVGWNDEGMASQVGGYVVEYPAGTAAATLTFKEPAEGAVYIAPATVLLKVVAVDPDGDIRRVEFFANDHLIGVSEHLTRDAVIPGRSREHVFEWKEFGAGTYRLSAKAKATNGSLVQSDTRSILVKSPSLATRVRVETIDGEATEVQGPSDAVDSATFRISRDGDLSREIVVFYSLHGTARNGADYQELQTSVRMPAGQPSVDLGIYPLADALTVVEKMETVGIRLEPSPLSGPAGAYDIDPQNREAAAVIYEQQPPRQGALELAVPRDGLMYRGGETVTILAAAFHPRFHVGTVDFYADDVMIGSSQLVSPSQHFVIEAEDFDFDGGSHQAAADAMPYTGGAYMGLEAVHGVDYFRPVDVMESDLYRQNESPNVPMLPATDPASINRGGWNMEVNHRIGWINQGTWYNYSRNFPPGQYRVYAALSHGTTEPNVMRGSLAKVTGGAGTPQQTLQEIGEFSASGSGSWTTSTRVPLTQGGEPVTLSLNGLETWRYTAQSGDYDYLLLESQFPQHGGLVVHKFSWNNAPAGTHTLTARTTLPDGQQLVSGTFRITVEGVVEKPLVGIRFVPHQTLEPWPNADFAPGSLEVSRSGSTAEPLLVFFDVSGTATPDVDYERIVPESILIPAGQPAAHVFVKAKDDLVDEPDETVVLTLVPAPAGIDSPYPTDYAIDPNRRSAEAVILDNDEPTVATLTITAPKTGAVFSAGAGIPISAIAVDPQSYISAVDFYSGETRIGSSQIEFFRAPDPGTPIEHFFGWDNAPVGRHRLTARAVDSQGQPVISQPVEISVVGDGLEFTVTFAHPPRSTPATTEIFTRTYTTSGPVGGGRLLPGMRVVRMGDYYGNQWQSVYRINADTKAVAEITPAGPNIPELSWPMGVAADTKRNRIVVVSLGGEGFLYGYSPATAAWTLIASMNNRDVDSIEYHAADDHYYAVAITGGGVPGRIHRIDSTGKVTGEIALPPIRGGIGFSGHRSEIVSVGENLALLVEQENQVGFGSTVPDPGTESLIYLIRPATKEVSLIYRKLWENAAPSVSIVAPADGTTVALRESIQLRAKATDDRSVQSVEFLANGNRLGSAVKTGDPDVWQFTWQSSEVGSYRITAQATDQHGAKTISAHVSVVVKETILPLTVAIVSPAEGAHFTKGSAIEITAVASQGDRAAAGVRFYSNGQLLGVGVRDPIDPKRFAFRWTTAPEGNHRLTAQAFDLNLIANSAPVNITVDSTATLLVARRDLPDGYLAGRGFQVRIDIEPSSQVNAYAVEDQPPAGWAVTQISHEGVFDSLNRKVKFGPFTDHQARALTYTVTPPANATGTARFTGRASANGVDQALTGDQRVEPGDQHHPADNTPQDNRIQLNEVTAYAASWKENVNWPIGPNPIPVSYVTRAGALWKQGEAYLYSPNSGAPPMCWIPARIIIPHSSSPAPALASSYSAIRTVSMANGAVQVSVAIEAGDTVAAYAIEEEIPSGCSASEISEGGVAAGSVVRWGPFFDGAERTLRYTLSGAAPQEARFHGTASFDGSSELVAGDTRITAGQLTVELRSSGAEIVIRLSSPAPSDAVIEATDSLNPASWAVVSNVAAGATEAVLNAGGSGSQWFFRLRLSE